MEEETPPQKVTFVGKEKSGPHILIFGAIHGDEGCGPIAIEKVIQKIKNGVLTLGQGSVTFVPICNPKAHREKTRVHKENLNRIFKKTEQPHLYEEHLANYLCELVDTCDALLDIHSSFVSAPSHAFVDYPTPENMAFAKALNPEFLLFDWPAVYENNPFAFPAWTTDRYAHEAGKIGILVECGKHDDPIALRRAEDAILRTLAHFELIPSTVPDTNATEPKAVYMNRIFRRESANDRFTQTWTHLQFVPAGTHVAEYASGEQVYTEHDSYVLFPKDYALPGGEWFYLGQQQVV